MSFQNTPSHFKKYARIRVFTDLYFPHKDRIYNSTIYTEKIRVRENPYSSMFYGVTDLTKGTLRKTISDFDQK